jgi:hypothetical protein
MQRWRNCQQAPNKKIIEIFEKKISVAISSLWA